MNERPIPVKSAGEIYPNLVFGGAVAGRIFASITPF
jgi:hypothetical protein